VDGQLRDRIFSVNPGASATISGLRLIHGFAGGTDAKGTAVYNQGNLILQDCSVSNNKSFPTSGKYGTHPGGALYNGGVLQLSHCSVTQNQTHGDFVEAGGIENTGTLFVEDSLVADNLVTTDSYWAGVASGGGIVNGGEARVVDSTISGNTAVAGGGADGGGISNRSGSLLVDSSLLFNNTAHADEAFGGAVSIFKNGSATLNNSTLASNLATAMPSFTGDPINAFGGGVYEESDATALTIRFCTIAANHAIGGFDGSYGGGINALSITLHNTIVAGNAAGKYLDIDSHLMSSGYNLIGDSTGGTGYAPTDLLDVDPQLGPLQDNGGLSWTMALLPGSPAIDSGDNTGAPMWDQRGPGFPRIVNGTIDRGAFEVQNAAGPAGVPSVLATAPVVVPVPRLAPQPAVAEPQWLQLTATPALPAPRKATAPPMLARHHPAVAPDPGAEVLGGDLR
jgi:hypothetical protein